MLSKWHSVALNDEAKAYLKRLNNSDDHEDENTSKTKDKKLKK